VSGSFNSGATSYTFPSKILDNRVLVGYQNNGSSNNGVSYVLDLSTETLKSIAGIAKEAGVESNVIDVVTQGECDFLSGLTPGSYYYSSDTGFLSASVADYEIGVAKSATNLKMNGAIVLLNKTWLEKIESLVASGKTPSFYEALQYNVWNTRSVFTGTGTFTVPSGVYFLGIACIGKGGNGHTDGAGGGGGGVALKVKKVFPGQTIAYTLSAGGVASCDGMVANPGTNASSTSSAAGGSASGGTYNYAGGWSGYNFGGGGGGAGGGVGGQGRASTQYGGGGGAGFIRIMWSEALGSGYGGYAESNTQYGATGGGAGGNGAGQTSYGSFAWGGNLGVSAYTGGPTKKSSMSAGRIATLQLLGMQRGFIVTTDLAGTDGGGNRPIEGSSNTDASSAQDPTWGCGGSMAWYSSSMGVTFPSTGGSFGGGGGGGCDGSYGPSAGGFGGGGGGAWVNTGTMRNGAAGGFGSGGGGSGFGSGGSGGFGGGGGGGYSGGAQSGGAAVVVFIY
jgi:hypothetical protein